MKRLLVLVSLLLCSGAHAQGVATFTYQKGAVEIARANPPPLPNLPWQGESAPAKPDTSNVQISVDIRPLSSFYRQDGWYNMGNLEGLNGMLFIAETPKEIRVGSIDYYRPLDIVWIDNNGIITSIAPNLNLAANREGLSDPKISKGLLLLPGGSAQLQGIAPGDKIVGSEFFAAPPRVLTYQP